MSGVGRLAHLSRAIPVLAAGCVLALSSLAFAACDVPGSEPLDPTEPIDTERARQLFQSTCRACHTLAAADSYGVFGPSLDLLQPEAERVREQIDTGGGAMPDELLSGEDADIVAIYVANAAGSVAPPGVEEGARPRDRADGEGG